VRTQPDCERFVAHDFLLYDFMISTLLNDENV